MCVRSNLLRGLRLPHLPEHQGPCTPGPAPPRACARPRAASLRGQGATLTYKFALSAARGLVLSSCTCSSQVMGPEGHRKGCKCRKSRCLKKVRHVHVLHLLFSARDAAAVCRLSCTAQAIIQSHVKLHPSGTDRGLFFICSIASATKPEWPAQMPASAP